MAICTNGIPTETKARRIVQCSGDDPIRVEVSNPTIDFEHTILCELGEGGVYTGTKVLVVTTFSNDGVPTITYFDVATGEAWVGTDTGLRTCPVEGGQVDTEIKEMCDGGTTSFLRWFFTDGGIPIESSYDSDLSGNIYTATGIVTFGACESGTMIHTADCLTMTGTDVATGYPDIVESITVTALTNTVIVTTLTGTITIPEGGSYSWGAGTSEWLDVTGLVFTGSAAGSEYTLHWEAIPLV